MLMEKIVCMACAQDVFGVHSPAGVRAKDPRRNTPHCSECGVEFVNEVKGADRKWKVVKSPFIVDVNIG